MSSNDKTRQKLVESMRKTKAGASKNSPAVEPEEESKPANVVNKKTSAKKEVTTNTKTPQQSNDPFQSGRRVWPD